MMESDTFVIGIRDMMESDTYVIGIRDMMESDTFVFIFAPTWGIYFFYYFLQEF